jgi:hypothetical protein
MLFPSLSFKASSDPPPPGNWSGHLSQNSFPHLLLLVHGPCSQFEGKNSLLTVALEAEDAFLETVQGHEADVLKHV